MRPVPIHESQVPEGATRMVVAAPDGRLDYDGSTLDKPLAVEAIRDDAGFHVLVSLEKSDYVLLAKHGLFWLNFHTDRLPVFSLFTPDLGDES